MTEQDPKKNDSISNDQDIKEIEETGAWGVAVECVPEDILGEIILQHNLYVLSSHQYLLDSHKLWHELG